MRMPAACRERGLRAFEKACPLLVPLVEEGWVDHPVTAEVIRIYLTELLEQAQEAELDPDTLVLGCTHYPLLRPMMEAAVSPGDPGHRFGRRRPPARRPDCWAAIRWLTGTVALRADCRFFATDSVAKFQRLGARFLGSAINEVELVDLGG